MGKEEIEKLSSRKVITSIWIHGRRRILELAEAVDNSSKRQRSEEQPRLTRKDIMGMTLCAIKS